MRKQARPGASIPSVNRSARQKFSEDLCTSDLLPSLKILDSKNESANRRSEARIELHVAIFSGDMVRLREGVENARACGLSYWEIEPSVEILKSHES